MHSVLTDLLRLTVRAKMLSWISSHLGRSPSSCGNKLPSRFESVLFTKAYENISHVGVGGRRARNRLIDKICESASSPIMNSFMSSILEPNLHVPHLVYCKPK